MNSYFPRNTPFFLALFLWILCDPAHALLTSEARTTPQSTAYIIIDRDSAIAGETFWVALKLELQEGWHSYANPAGDGGYPTEITMTAPQNIGISPIHWQVAHRFETDGIVNYGYTKEAWHFVEISVPDDTSLSEIPLQVQARWLVCKEICIPEEGQWEMRVPIRPIPAVTDAVFTQLRMHATPNKAVIEGKGDSVIPMPRENDDKTETTKKEGITAFLLAFLSAFLGGIILNLMPCVLPILSLKVISLIKIAQHSRRIAAQHGLSYMAGILCGFTGVAGLLWALQAGGASLGWGFQLQSPAVVVGLSLLMLTIGLNLSGVFELPTLFANAGSSKTHGGGLTASFFTGLLAVIVATPCTAPFMAGALGFALLHAPWVQWVIFMGLGLGLAFPYVMISLCPSLHRFLPKSGAWMLRFKQFLAFPMYAAAAWLAWVATKQHGADLLSLLFTAALLLSCGLWLMGQCALHSFLKKILSAMMVAVIALLLWWSGGEDKPSAFLALSEPYSATRLQALRDAGKPVFIYATADWCVTCKLNERLVLRQEAVVAHVQTHHITVLKADWTQSDPAITALLTNHQLAGVPAYIYYGKAAAPPVILPSLLTVERVITTLQ